MSLTGSASDAARAAPAVECRSIRKTFPGVVALDDVSLSVARGEIHALLGQNGAGKSTLVKILTGIYQPDSGQIFVGGREVRLRDGRDAEANGIAIVHQDQQLVAQFDVVSNALLGNETVTAGGFLDRAAMRRSVQSALDRVAATFSPDTLVRDLSVAQRAQVAIAAALLRNPTALILDEPTASLSEQEAEQLFGIIRALRDQGVTIIYISHYIDEVLNLVDRVTVLRDGRLVATTAVGEVSRAEVVRMIVGREVAQLYPKETVTIGEPLLEVRGLTEGRALRGIDLTVRRGEILGIAGLVGAGRSELAMTLVGALPRTGGTVTVAGKPSRPSDPRHAKRDGFALIPEDRRHEGLITDLSVRENLTLPNISRWARFGLLNLGREKAAAQELVGRLNIQPPSLKPRTRNLSGGNQQKIVVGRWLTGDAKVFLFDEPTTGVDVGSKIEIYRQMVELAREGAAVIFISSDFEEVAAMCDRTVVMRRGRIVHEITDRSEMTPETLLYWASGSGDGSTAAEAPPTQSRQSATTDFLARWGTVIGMLVVLAIIAAMAPQFLSINNVFDVLKQGSVLAFIALGLTVVLIAGGFDMSAGATSQFAANVAAGTLIGGSGAAAAVALGGALGLAVGAVNAALILVLRIPAFVATLGMMFVIMGATLLYNGGQALTLSNQPGFFFIGQGYVGPVPFVFILLVAVTFVLHVILRRTRLGLRMYAVGQNEAAAMLRGIGRSRYAFASCALGGLVLGIAGVVLASYSYGASALASGVDFLISALAATFLGSTMSRAGELTVIGTVIAAIFLASLSNGLILMGISNQALPGVQGIVLVLSISLGLLRRRSIGQILIF
ncbi:ATP-binding cassette domain-containing protein [Kaistia geumhonensis]|uniref:Ribose transport system ATP-binding protein n=1 Tax=Kaistia geumhonensis TaxID=410839 RepID=A0ABU0M792_9HYPH|nr:ATP-binding cassette domain-containing protein [Kaistia geumhonensis]MCX5477952.1 ATP-binding cassette domain-containing protein [Kaistia geumhonensis]MDQ0516835.1 ribose transport system ATP-binding protein [Kaistia geumhonensis]